MAQSGTDHSEPQPSEINRHGHKRSGVKGHVKRQSGVVPAEQPGKKHQVRGARYRQEFGQTLNDGEDDRLIEGHLNFGF